MQYPGLDAGLNPSALPSYLAFGYVPTPATFYHNTRALPPASCLVLEEGFEPRVRPYWEADFNPRPVPWGQAKREVRRLVRQSVERRLVADVPLGVLLSGGLDSTIITAVTTSLIDEPLRRSQPASRDLLRTTRPRSPGWSPRNSRRSIMRSTSVPSASSSSTHWWMRTMDPSGTLPPCPRTP